MQQRPYMSLAINNLEAILNDPKGCIYCLGKLQP